MQVHSAEQMQQLGHRIARISQGSDVLILTGELGAGKTTLAQGIAQGLGITEPVTSPTFVLSKQYRNPREDGLNLVHLDVYRIGSVDELLDLWSEADAAHALTLVEWGAPWSREFGDSVAELVLSIGENDARVVEIAADSRSGGDFAQRIASVL